MDFKSKNQIVLTEVPITVVNATNEIIDQSHIFKPFNIDKLGNFVDTFYEDNNCCLKAYETRKKIENADEYNNDLSLFQITLFDKKTKKENIIFYFIFNNNGYMKTKMQKAYINNNDIYLAKDVYGVAYGSTISIYVISNYNKTDKYRIIYKYNIPNTSFDGIHYKDIEFISNNIIKLTFDDKVHNREKIEFFKLTQSKEDIKKNKEKYPKDFEERIFGRRLLWTNYLLGDTFHKSYDYFEQETEPTMKQLKEKFPNDTFFDETKETEAKTVTDKEVKSVDDTGEKFFKNKDENLDSPQRLFTYLLKKWKTYMVNIINKWQA